MNRFMALVLSLICTLSLMGCSKQSQTGVPIKDAQVPEKEILIENMVANGYTIIEQTSVDGLALTVDRVVAEKGNSFIDIVYGLTDEEANKVFDLYFEIYPDDYYALSRDGSFVYCVSDEKTFYISGIADTTGIGLQHADN